MAKKILLIDDEKEVVQIIRKYVQHAGYDAYAAYDGQQGLEIAHDLHPHLILTDLGMPVMDGICFYNELKKAQDISHIPVIIVSAYGTREEQMRQLGVKDYLLKPFDRQTLINKVDSFFKTQKALKVLVATKMLHLMKIIVDGAKPLVEDLQVRLTNDQSAVADEALASGPDVVLLDVDMFTAFSAPGTIRYLRQYGQFKETRILLMRGIQPAGAAGQDKVVEECLDAGASHYIGCLNQESFSHVLREYCC